MLLAIHVLQIQLIDVDLHFLHTTNNFNCHKCLSSFQVVLLGITIVNEYSVGPIIPKGSGCVTFVDNYILDVVECGLVDINIIILLVSRRMCSQTVSNSTVAN